MMDKFTTSESYTIAGVGTAFIVPAPYEMNRAKPEIIGKDVEINGTVYRITGVERSLTPGPIRIGDSIGLWVAGAPRPGRR